MIKYLLELTPQEPYFFGNEKAFKYPGQKVGGLSSQYFIKSELTPAQTTVIGTLRYILLPVKKAFGNYTKTDLDINSEAVGEKGFEYGEENKFGKIRHVSPLFLLKDGKRLVPTPFDHKIGEKKYTPFSKYVRLGDVEYPDDYDAKKGLSHSFMCVDGEDRGKIYNYEEIFKADVRVGINRSKDKGGFFKRQYWALRAGFSFGAYVELEDDMEPNDTAVYMGQGKSLFTASFTKLAADDEKGLENNIRSLLRDDVVYCLSDAFVGNGIYEKSKFSITDTRDYRAFIVTNGKITKRSALYKLICAGSIFIPKENDFAEAFENKSVSIIGYNTILQKTEDK